MNELSIKKIKLFKTKRFRIRNLKIMCELTQLTDETQILVIVNVNVLLCVDDDHSLFSHNQLPKYKNKNKSIDNYNYLLR